ncbi:MAG: recombinase family protein [bacterium]
MFTSKYVIDNKMYKVGLSIRLSREDGDDIESESVTNQRILLTNFINSLGSNFEIVETYTDDGFSGLNFNRPGFQKLVRDIELGKINMVVTKDLSRLGRDYIETGYYIEKYFPEKNIRYIAINDNIDTFNEKCSGADMMPFRLGMNDMYAKDISKKVKSSFMAMKQAGKFIGGTCPYGYMRDPNDKHKLIIDPVAAPIVKRIFDLYVAGYGTRTIATMLTKENIPTPLMHQKNTARLKRAEYPHIWKHPSVNNILKNEMYTGKLIQNKGMNLNYKSKKRVVKPKEEWIIIQDAMEAIIDETTFKIASKLRNKSNIYDSNRRNVEYALGNLVYCKDCGSKLGISYDKKRDRTSMNCNTYRKYSAHNICFSHHISYDKLEKTVYENIRNILVNLESKEYEDYLKQMKNDPLAPLNKIIVDIKRKVEKLERKIDTLYDDKISGIISVERFKKINETTEQEIFLLKKSLAEYECEKSSLLDSVTKIEDYKTVVKQFLNVDNPTKEMINKLIEKIYITKEKTVEIIFAINDCDNFIP